MTKFFYSVLQYKHSQLLDERLNVGILFYFPDNRKLFFKKPSKLGRLNHLYKDFSDVQLKGYLDHFESKTAEINYSLNDQQFEFELFNFNEAIEKKYLNIDATVFCFSEIKQSKLYKDYDSVISEYSDIFFSHYEHKANRLRKDDASIIRAFKTIIHQKDPHILSKLDKDELVKNDTTSCKFDFKWQNGSVNYIKSLSLDLLDTTEINHKALLYRAIFEALFDKNENKRVDVLLAPPSVLSNESIEAFSKAEELLAQTQANINLVSNYQDYIDGIILYFHSKE